MVADGHQRDDWAPINATWSVVDRWLADFPFDTAFLAQDAAWSPVFSARSFDGGRAELDELWTTGGEVSWLGGPAVQPLPQWPRRTDGKPLAHVITIALADLDGAAMEDQKCAWPEHREGLPSTGVLEVFHDLTVYGWELADRQLGSWSVRWVEHPDRSSLMEAPEDVNTPTDVCQPGLFMPGFSLRSPMDFAFADKVKFDAAETVTEALRRTWMFQQTGSADEYPVPVTHVYGYSSNGTSGAREILNLALPLESGDSHRLILDLESWTHLSGWFGDAAPLEVWMRDSDLAARRFGRAWCIIRTD